MGRATRNIVSGYSRERVFQANLYAFERRELVTDFNGAIPAGVSIVRAVWNTQDTLPVAMSDPSINPGGRSCKVMLQAQVDGFSCIRLDAELSNGERYSQWHVIRILPARYMSGDTWVNGPSQLVATA